jgi:hypothetical protein
VKGAEVLGVVADGVNGVVLDAVAEPDDTNGVRDVTFEENVSLERLSAALLMFDENGPDKFLFWKELDELLLSKLLLISSGTKNWNSLGDVLSIFDEDWASLV